MRLFLSLLLVSSITGCATATKYVESPAGSLDVTPFIGSAGPFMQRGDDCVFSVTFRDGVRTEIRLRAERCAAGLTWMRLETVLRQQQAQAQAARPVASPPVTDQK